MNEWISHVKRYAKQHNMSYKEAMSKARPSYKPKPKSKKQRGGGLVEGIVDIGVSQTKDHINHIKKGIDKSKKRKKPKNFKEGLKRAGKDYLDDGKFIAGQQWKLTKDVANLFL